MIFWIILRYSRDKHQYITSFCSIYPPLHARRVLACWVEWVKKTRRFFVFFHMYTLSHAPCNVFCFSNSTIFTTALLLVSLEITTWALFPPICSTGHARLYIGWRNRFLGSLNVYKSGLWCTVHQWNSLVFIWLSFLCKKENPAVLF